jgi:hypothetical protein
MWENKLPKQKRKKRKEKCVKLHMSILKCWINPVKGKQSWSIVLLNDLSSIIYQNVNVKGVAIDS